MHPYVNIAIKAARAAGTIINRSIDRMSSLKIEQKGADNDFVTNIDKACEKEIIDIIKQAYPRHGVLGEESGFEKGQEEVIWIIDPIDGTLNFIHGFPYLAVSIGIQVNGEVEHGVVYNPLADELFTASKGRGAQLNSKKIRVSDNHRLQYSLLATGFAYKRAGMSTEQCLSRLGKFLDKCSDIRRGGAAALDLANVAAGRLDGFWEVGLKPWDIAAGAILIKEAGGFISDFSGSSRYLDSGEIVTGNRKIYTQMLKLLEDS